jgi:chromosome segregation ATPase
MLNSTVALQATANTLADRLDGYAHHDGTVWNAIMVWAAAEPGYPAGRAADQIDDITRPAAATLRDLAKRLADTEVDSGVLRRELAEAREIITNLRSDNATLRDELALARGLNATLRERNDRQAATIMSKREENEAQDAKIEKLIASSACQARTIIRMQGEQSSSAALVDKAALTYLQNRNTEQNGKLLDQANTIGSLSRVIVSQGGVIRTQDATIREHERRLENQGRSIRAYQRELAEADTKLREAEARPRDISNVLHLRTRIDELTAALAKANARAYRLREALGKIDTNIPGLGYRPVDWTEVAITRREIASAAIRADNT